MSAASPSNAASSAGSTKDGSYASKSSTKAGTGAKSLQDYVSFRPIKEHQWVSGPPSTHLYTRGGSTDYSELSYKLLKCEARCVRSTLETHGFVYTESHDWNVLWIVSMGKPYLYDGLNEYQKIITFLKL
mmetsp:Transcript_26768/g.26679  ORF Transcript_26768/g.26679 Transcript_26768/m.26679 type:complete len:130 (-) Transcript_26768:7-396(-)